ncbi:DoxX family membrane protein [Streptomyces lunaelactis]|uniref:DoxX family membrane protein n=1 Tax=Streptomyces lunaelactis TaxID=1535768 RepID=UPI0015857793|nr:DoxX family membrane protein [Streptomyces lunaelactis]NUK08298.1 DoxX family membrane protein [Streptomyces lunaelactis]NUK61458.1 DoxX family membrane protein [Streptomyces lunaelactis]NUL13151.1 DoxX family membrane protein [Streptomyces lunaelactis]NUL25862.1 DoxX family membrane protein [Streptomyces lunaelactis]
MVKVDCDPAQVIVNHASFRVRLAQSPRPARTRADTARIPVVGGAGSVGRRRAPVVWSGKSAPGDVGATGLLQAVRNSTAERGTFDRDSFDRDSFDRDSFDRDSFDRDSFDRGSFDTGATQVIPRIDLDAQTTRTPTVGPPGGPGDSGRPLLPQMRQAVGAYDSYHSYGQEPQENEEFEQTDGDARAHRHGADAVRHAYYPGRRMNLGVVLLPLRVFLGFISIYAGMGKLCDPVYFDGGERGSMVKWLNSLHPWALAEPLRDFALSHPVGAGLTVAFLQVVVGVLTVLGLWQRVAAVVGALLSAALILTVNWKTVAAYDAPDIIYLAAWSPLIIAGAPVYSADGRLAGEAWRKLGPRSELWELRRRVLRRGTVVASLVVGLTLLTGSMLGGAVRSSDMVTVPGPNQDPTNHLPGAPLPEEPGGESSSANRRGEDGRPSPSATRSGTPEAEKAKPSEETVRETGRVEGGQPSQTQGTGQQPPGQSEPAPPPSSSSGPSSSGGTGSGGGNGGGSGGGDGGSGDGGSGGGRVIGGLLG